MNMFLTRLSMTTAQYLAAAESGALQIRQHLLLDPDDDEPCGSIKARYAGGQESLCGPNVYRQAIRALLHDLTHLAIDSENAVSKGFVRGRFDALKNSWDVLISNNACI
jgi:hypothetical protein